MTNHIEDEILRNIKRASAVVSKRALTETEISYLYTNLQILSTDTLLQIWDSVPLLHKLVRHIIIDRTPY